MQKCTLFAKIQELTLNLRRIYELVRVKQRKTLSGWLTSRYLLIIRNEEDFAEKSTYNFTYARLIVFSTIIFIAIFSIALLAFNTLLGKWMDPRYAQKVNRQMLVNLSSRVDSLDNELQRRDQFIGSFQTMMNGGVPMVEDTTTATSASIDPDEINIDYKAPVDSVIRKEFEKQDYSLTFSNKRESELIDMFLFKPIEGVITQEYKPQKDHLAIDIVAKPDEPVKSTASGTVILSSWTEDSGNVIMVQHQHNLMSVYKHNAVVLKKLGSYVEAGEIIAIVGNSGELTTGPHLHFELWHNGKAINPLNYINY